MQVKVFGVGDSGDGAGLKTPGMRRKALGDLGPNTGNRRAFGDITNKKVCVYLRPCCHLVLCRQEEGAQLQCVPSNAQAADICLDISGSYQSANYAALYVSWYVSVCVRVCVRVCVDVVSGRYDVQAWRCSCEHREAVGRTTKDEATKVSSWHSSVIHLLLAWGTLSHTGPSLLP